MKANKIRIASHIKWSKNKFGNIIIFNRRSDSQISSIESESGKEIWSLLANNVCKTNTVMDKDVYNTLHELYAPNVPHDVLNQDIQLFLDSLLKENIIDRVLI